MDINRIKSAINDSLGIGELNPMQTAVIVSNDSRIMLFSPTGSGKTIAFLGNLMRRLEQPGGTDQYGVQAIVIAPSRELVRQIFDVARPLLAPFGMKTLAVYGGNPFHLEESSLKGSLPALIIATPGRLLDHINRGTLDVSAVRNMVIDEYDKTLEMGFLDEMKKICSAVGKKLPSRHLDFVMLTSATRLKDVPEFIDLKNAEIIDFTQQSTVRSRLRIYNVPSFDKDKLNVLAALIRNISQNGQCIVFVNHRESAERIGTFLDKEKISAVVYHGGFDQQKREIALAKFNSRTAKVLVSTDLAGRGIDIDHVASVIHYHPAPSEEIWTHRNGRTARVDNTGDVYVISAPDQDTPEFVSTDNDYYPDATLTHRVEAEKALVYLDKGKHDKLSRGDILGFITKKAGIAAVAVGKISLGNSYALVAIDPHEKATLLAALRSEKIKNIKVRATEI